MPILSSQLYKSISPINHGQKASYCSDRVIIIDANQIRETDTKNLTYILYNCAQLFYNCVGELYIT